MVNKIPCVLIKYKQNIDLIFTQKDGINITAVTIELINIINSLLTNTECNEMRTVLEPVESLNYLTEKYGMFGKKQRETVDFLSKKEPVEFHLPTEFKIYNETGLKISLLKLNKDLTNEIVRKAKHYKIKLTSFLISAFCFALKDLYIENDLKCPNILTCLSPANMRIRYQPNMSFSDMRMQVCVPELVLNENKINESQPVDIWKYAEYVQVKIHESTDLNLGAIFGLSYERVCSQI